MTIVDFIPKDNEYYRKIYEPQGNGVCGVALLAVLTKSTLKNVLRTWGGIGGYRGYTGLSELKIMLKKLGFNFKLHRGNKAKNFKLYEDKTHICRVQWLGKEGGEYHGYKCFHDACSQSHWILIIGDMFYCNSGGWSELRWLPEYLENGYITSYLEVSK